MIDPSAVLGEIVVEHADVAAHTGADLARGHWRRTSRSGGAAGGWRRAVVAALLLVACLVLVTGGLVAGVLGVAVIRAGVDDRLVVLARVVGLV